MLICGDASEGSLTLFNTSPVAKSLVFFLLLIVAANHAVAQSADSSALGQFLTQRGYKSVPLQKYASGHLSTEVVINGVTGRFILDTGAGGTVVEEKRQSKFKMSSAPTSEKATGAGGA